jgi:hypothetical protein
MKKYSDAERKKMKNTVSFHKKTVDKAQDFFGFHQGRTKCRGVPQKSFNFFFVGSQHSTSKHISKLAEGTKFFQGQVGDFVTAIEGVLQCGCA